MSQNRSGLPILPILLGAGVIFLGVIVLGVAFYLILTSASRGQVQATPTLAVAAGRTLSFPTATTIPSATPTPTETSTPTSTPTLTPTNTPVPPTRPPATAVPPTAIPTATPIPATAVPPGFYHGLTVVYFRVENTSAGVGQDIWFDFYVKNFSSQTLHYGMLGAVALDGSGNNVATAPSWTGESLSPAPDGQLEWRDHINIPVRGNFFVYLIICYSDLPTCNTPNGEWELLSPGVPVTVN